VRVGVRRVRLALPRSQIKTVAGRSFHNANRIEIADSKTSLYVRSPPTQTG